MDTCPEHILTLASGGFPTPNFSLGECTFCEECAQACPTNALQVKTRATSPWQQAPVMNEQCLAKRGVVCRSCGDSCPREAIEFNLARAHPALATPQINNNACTGCGACISVCPNQALTMQIHPHPEEVQPT
jgi:MinD superfamily P-loop ATPase containing an inserted ferredoxin domain